MARYSYANYLTRTWGFYLFIAFIAGMVSTGCGASFLLSAVAGLSVFIVAFRLDNSHLSRWPAAIEIDGNKILLFRVVKYREISLGDVLRVERRPGHPFLSTRKVPWAEVTFCANDMNEWFGIESDILDYEELIAILSVAADNWQPHKHDNEL